ncbi:MAG: uridine phosphorylase [Deltaproteobacteria bacterium]|nr:uridine phosphorylase [Deltaproteobacteria bacterium]
MPKAYHLNIDKKDIKGSVTALLPGDPARCRLIASEITKRYGGSARLLAEKREFTSYLVCGGKKTVLVTSTGIGGPSASIAIEELARLGIKNFLRVGTTGSIQKNIKAGDAVITTASVRLDGASLHYAPIEYPAVADFSIVNALIMGAKAAKIKFHAGISASSDTFYQGEERHDRFRKYIIRAIKGSTTEWKALHVLNFEMESATILTVAASMGLKAGCVTGVVNKGGEGNITPEKLRLGESAAVKTAIAALAYMEE